MALRYMTARKRYPSRCPRCQGSGRWLTNRGNRRVYVDCIQCAGNGRWVSDKHYRMVHYDLRSPAFRNLDGIDELLEREYRAARAGKPWPRRVARVRIKDVELIDATHAIAWVGIDADKISTETRWIWVVPKGKKKGDWFVYDSRADGPWPEEDKREPIHGHPTQGWEPLTAEEHRKVREAVATAKLKFRSIEYGKQGASLLVRLVPRDAFRGERALQHVGGDAVRLMRSLYRAKTPWRDIDSEWLTEWKDRWGRIAFKPAWHATLGRADAERAQWQNLSPTARIEVLSWRQIKHVGWKPAPMDEKPAPSDGPKSGPPEERTPQDSAPQTEAPAAEGETPTEPASKPDRPRPVAPAPTTEPEPEMDPNFTMPELTSRARKAGDEAVAEINQLFERAKSVNAEGAQAREAGAHSLWQEKLAEVRVVMGEIEDVWNEKIVPAMPGKDELEKDMVANHYFGDVWGELDQLKAAVRKVSR